MSLLCLGEVNIPGNQAPDEKNLHNQTHTYKDPPPQPLNHTREDLNTKKHISKGIYACDFMPDS